MAKKIIAKNPNIPIQTENVLKNNSYIAPQSRYPQIYQELFEYLSHLVINPQNCARIPNLSQLIEEIATSREKNYLNPESLNMLSSTLKCFFCRREPHFRFNCNHFCCVDCLNQSTENIKENTAFPRFFKVPCCNSQHSNSEMKRITGQFWENIEEDLLSKRKDLKIDKFCSVCETQKPNHLFVKSLCSHHEICKECAAEKFRNEPYKCNKCANSVSKEPEEESQGYCCNCGEMFYYIGDYLTTICEDHTFCYNCLQECLEKKSCLFCSMALTEKDFEKIGRKMFKNCRQCNSMKESIYMLDYHCRNGLTCVACQTLIGRESREGIYHCVDCKEMLGNNSISLVQEFDLSLTVTRFS